jgi:dihydroxynaphthoic acid synthetase
VTLVLVEYPRPQIALITLNRPERMNSMAFDVMVPLKAALEEITYDNAVRVVVLTGAGRGFSSGADHKSAGEVPHVQGLTRPTYALRSMQILDDVILALRRLHQPVIAAVNGAAIGGGHVLHVLADITIAADHAIFGQNGPRVGSFDAGFGTSYLARVVGEKRAREIWFLCRRYDAATADRWGLVNRVVPLAELRAEVRRWADEILALSPTSLRFLKQSFNADSEHIAGVGSLAFSGLHQFVDSAEAREGVQAFAAKREPDFAPFRASVSA